MYKLRHFSKAWEFHLKSSDVFTQKKMKMSTEWYCIVNNKTRSSFQQSVTPLWWLKRIGDNYCHDASRPSGPIAIAEASGKCRLKVDSAVSRLVFSVSTKYGNPKPASTFQTTLHCHWPTDILYCDWPVRGWLMPVIIIMVILQVMMVIMIMIMTTPIYNTCWSH